MVLGGCDYLKVLRRVVAAIPVNVMDMPPIDDAGNDPMFERLHILGVANRPAVADVSVRGLVYQWLRLGDAITLSQSPVGLLRHLLIP